MKAWQTRSKTMKEWSLGTRRTEEPEPDRGGSERTFKVEEITWHTSVSENAPVEMGDLSALSMRAEAMVPKWRG